MNIPGALTSLYIDGSLSGYPKLSTFSLKSKMIGNGVLGENVHNFADIFIDALGFVTILKASP